MDCYGSWTNQLFLEIWNIKIFYNLLNINEYEGRNVWLIVKSNLIFNEIKWFFLTIKTDFDKNRDKYEIFQIMLESNIRNINGGRAHKYTLLILKF